MPKKHIRLGLRIHSEVATVPPQRCTAAVPNCWPEDEEIDLGMSADFVFKCGATAHFDCSFVAGEAAGPVTVRVEGSRGTMTVSNYNGGANNGNEIVIRQTADGGIPETLQESVDGPFPNSRGTMYWQLLNFVAECEKCRAAPAHHKAKPWCARSSTTKISCRSCLAINFIEPYVMLGPTT
eukprot:SAG31_NODE_1833_length_7137_cov_2.587667_11_plen_181_part_00